MTTEKDEPFLLKFFKDEENYNIVLSIREELMDQVMDECYKGYLKKQTPRFIVQCAYDALVKFLSFEFYYHPKTPDLTESIWISDEPIEPSPKDSWSCDAVPIRSRDFEPEESEDEFKHENESLQKTVSIKNDFDKDMKYCECLEHVCTCLVSPADLYQKRGTVSSVSSKRKFEKSSKQSSMITQDGISEIKSVRSVQYPSSTTSTNRSAFRVGSIKSKTEKKTPQMEESQLDIPHNIPPITAPINAVRLPPIRITSNLRTKPITKEKKKY